MICELFCELRETSQWLVRSHFVKFIIYVVFNTTNILSIMSVVCFLFPAIYLLKKKQGWLAGELPFFSKTIKWMEFPSHPSQRIPKSFYVKIVPLKEVSGLIDPFWIVLLAAFKWPLGPQQPHSRLPSSRWPRPRNGTTPATTRILDSPNGSYIVFGESVLPRRDFRIAILIDNLILRLRFRLTIVVRMRAKLCQ